MTPRAGPSPLSPLPPLSPRVLLCTVFAMLAFAGNSLLCRLALRYTDIDAVSFTTIRMLSGAAMLWLLVRWRHRGGAATLRAGNWPAALALLVYALCFSLAYVQLSAATGALLLFGAVQATMIGRGLWMGERPGALQIAGYLLAAAGLAGMLWPGLTAPPLVGALLMLAAGVAWGIYSVLGKREPDGVLSNAGNFLRASALMVPLYLVSLNWARHDATGALYAVLSGAVASGIGYAIWYAALRGLSVTTAGLVQLSVPVIAAAGGVALLGEAVSWRLVVASGAVLGGVALGMRLSRQGRGKTSV